MFKKGHKFDYEMHIKYSYLCVCECMGVHALEATSCNFWETLEHTCVFTALFLTHSSLEVYWGICHVARVE